jgi:CHAT domain-containing protein
MVGFHRTLAQQKVAVTRAAALRDAELAVMRRPGWRHPFYWSGFVLIGDGR